MAKDTELDAILDPNIFLDEEGQPIRDGGKKTTEQKLSEDSLKFLADTGISTLHILYFHF